MDTIHVVIFDTLSITSFESGSSPEDWSNTLSIISLVISSLALISSLLLSVFWNWYVSWKRDISIQWRDMAEDRIDLWRTLEIAYQDWNNQIKGSCGSLGELIKCSSIPKRLKCALKMKELDSLITDLRNGGPTDIKECQMALFQFCNDIWEKSIVLNDPLKIDEFGKVCSKLTWSLDGWAKMLYIVPRWTLKFAFILPLIPRRYLLKRFGSDWALMTILTYLELALKPKIKERWSNRSGLFRLAYKVNQQRASL